MKLIEKPVRSLSRGLDTMGERIEYLRCSLGFTVPAFIIKTGSRASTLKKVLEGKTNPTMTLLNNILKIFPVREEWLFLGTGDPFKVDDIDKYLYSPRPSDGIDDGINERFREVRMDKEMSQPVFASELGVTKDIVSFIEGKRSNVSVSLVKKLAKKFSVSEIWLLYGVGNKYKVKK